VQYGEFLLTVNISAKICGILDKFQSCDFYMKEESEGENGERDLKNK